MFVELFFSFAFNLMPTKYNPIIFSARRASNWFINYQSQWIQRLQIYNTARNVVNVTGNVCGDNVILLSSRDILHRRVLISGTA